MRICVIGANGRVGRHVVVEALRRGHRVTAAMRSPEKASALDLPPGLDDGLRVVAADVRDPESLRSALAGHDVVVSAVGPAGRRAGRLYSDGARATLTAMEQLGIDRFVGVTSAGVRYDDPHLAFWYRWLVRPLIGELYADMILMEEIVRAGDVDWTLVRPVLLLDREATGSYRVHDAATPARGRSITCADVAGFIVRELDEHRWSRRAPTLAH